MDEEERMREQNRIRAKNHRRLRKIKSAVLITGLTESKGALTQSASNMLWTLNTVTHFVHNPQGHTRNPQAFLQEEKSNGTFHCPIRIPLVAKGEV